MVRGIVILYDGREAAQGDIQELINDALFIAGDSKPTVVQFSGEKIANVLLSTCKVPSMPKEDGDQSVIVMAGMTDMTSFMSFSRTFITKLTNIDITNKEDNAFIRACSFLSKSAKEVPVSRSIAEKYGFTAVMRETIRSIYKEYKNGENLS